MIESQPTVTKLSLNRVDSIRATAEEGVYILNCNITDINGNTYDVHYGSRPEDSCGLNPAIRRWLKENTSVRVDPYELPTAEQIRAKMPSVTARQFRLGLVDSGLATAQVTAAIEAIPGRDERETAAIEWEYASEFDRSHPLIAAIGAALGLTEDQIDAIWLAAANL